MLGAGPAGLAAAWQLARRRRFSVTVLERQEVVGGNAGSFTVDGLRVDYGSHRLHPSCPAPILQDIRAMLGPDLLDRRRHGRIRLGDRWLKFPLSPPDLLMNLPPAFLWGLARDAVWRRNGAALSDETFASVLERSLGSTICREFYFPYALKIWGVPADALDAEQARRRVSAGSIAGMIRKALNAVPGFRPPGAGRFFYPRQGFGQISDAYLQAASDAGVAIRLGSPVRRIETDDGRATAVVLEHQGRTERLAADRILSTIPLPILARVLDTTPPEAVADAAAALRYRAMILIYLALETDRFTEYDAHYFPDVTLPISRLSEPKNYGLADAPGRTVLCAELPCSTDDEVWQAGDEELGELVGDSLARAGIPVRARVRAVVTRRLAQAYPIYLRGYKEQFERLDRWVAGLDGVVSLGRQGLFAHDNTHHTLAMAYAAAAALRDDGSFDAGRWAEHRREFESHVVED